MELLLHVSGHQPLREIATSRFSNQPFLFFLLSLLLLLFSVPTSVINWAPSICQQLHLIWSLLPAQMTLLGDGNPNQKVKPLTESLFFAFHTIENLYQRFSNWERCCQTALSSSGNKLDCPKHPLVVCMQPVQESHRASHLQKWHSLLIWEPAQALIGGIAVSRVSERATGRDFLNFSVIDPLKG